MVKNFLKSWGGLVASSKTRWLTIFIWILLIGIFSFIWPQVNDEETTDQQLLPDDMMSVQAKEIVEREFADDSGTPLLLVWYKDGGLELEDVEMIQEIYKELDAEPLFKQKMIPPFSEIPVEALLGSVSEDGEALTTPVFFENGTTTDEFKSILEDLRTLIEDGANEEITQKELDESGLHVRFSGPVGIQTDTVSLFSNADFTLLLGTVIIVFALLIILYRSPILALVPLVTVGIAYGVISPLLGFLAGKGWIEVDAQAISIMTVLLFGAGTDYCLFLISRYRDELRHERDKYTALKNAMSGVGGAIMMSSSSTVIGLLSLALGVYASYHRFAIPFSLSIFIMGIAALSILPAILALIGRFAFIPFVPRPEEMIQELEEKKGKKLRRSKETNKFGKKIGEVVTNRPWTVILITLIVLGGLAAFVPRIQYTYALLDSFPDDMPSKEGFTMISEHYPPGEIAPIEVIVDTDGEEIDLKEELEDHPFVEAVSDLEVGEENSEIKKWEVILSIDPYSAEAVESIPEIKEIAANALGGADDSVWIGGETATLYDTDQATSRDQSVIMPVLLLILAVMLMIFLRSIVAMAYLLFTVIISYASALGLGWIVLHYIFDVSAIQGLIPLYSFVFLVALGIDYNIFLVSSLWDYRKTFPLKDAISKSVAITGSVISSAGLILAGTFAVLATMPFDVLVHFGTITAIGILLDTFIVRPLLVPAITSVLGRISFWPGKLWKLKGDETLYKRSKNE
ncbi:MMPL family transporter [Oceanobacillus sp. AG]|uniref:MMPL family transporter n=1 Tax=Oceanobacillus sp. AG TaxID=2681969 RepID=UPI0012EB0798|nr:MMPL family transporter [Oceanobacillus sp. AG]